MKFNEIASDLQEVRMGTRDLSTFINSPIVKGIRAGFEAELCFTGLGGVDDSDVTYEPDYDEDISPRSIDQIAEFFSGDYNERQTINSLRDRLRQDFLEWKYSEIQSRWDDEEEDVIRKHVVDHEYDEDEEIKKYLEDDLNLGPEEVLSALDAGNRPEDRTGNQKNLFPEDNEAYAHYTEALEHAKNILEERIKELIDDQNRTYSMIIDKWEAEVSDDYTERDWLNAADLNSMADVESKYNVIWPYYTSSYTSSEDETGNEYDFSESNALAKSLANVLEVEVKASSGYHSISRLPDLWIIEPDSSIKAANGDMPAEIISPPMPLDECITKLREFTEWAKDVDAYTNNSTGLHVGVSLPNVGGNVDYIKLALFLGDKYVLDTFDRESNSYCESSLQKIENNIHNKSEVAINDALNDMRNGLIQLASSSVNRSGHGKYSSINMKSDYVEFRGMGGPKYLDNIEIVINMIQRFAMAMTIAADPNSYKQEYAKKLYKLLATKNTSQSIIELFSKYVSGQLSKVELKNVIRQAQLQRNVTTDPNKKMWWDVKYGNASIEVVATSKHEAINKARVHLGLTQQSDASDNDFIAKPIRPYTEL